LVSPGRGGKKKRKENGSKRQCEGNIRGKKNIFSDREERKKNIPLFSEREEEDPGVRGEGGNLFFYQQLSLLSGEKKGGKPRQMIVRKGEKG